MKILHKIFRISLILLFYCGVRYLPPSYYPGGRIWQKLRFLICRPLFGTCGKNVNIESKAYFHGGRFIHIGNNSGIGVNARLNGTIIIGNNVMMGQDVVIFSMNHNFSRTDIPMTDQGFQEDRPVTIGNDVWIGDRVIILPDVTIGTGAIIGAGAVVAKSIPTMAVAVGNPAKAITYREGFNRI